MVNADLVGVCCVYIVCCTETKSSRLEEVLILKFCCKDLLAYLPSQPDLSVHISFS